MRNGGVNGEHTKTGSLISYSWSKQRATTNNPKPFDYAQGDETIALRAAQNEGKVGNSARRKERKRANMRLTDRR